jgi:hypothetical protein
VAAPAAVSRQLQHPQSHEGDATSSLACVSVEAVIAQRQQASAEAGEAQLLFAIPSCCVGAVIGRGGKGLRDLQAQFGVRIYVEKEDYLGQRIVVVTAAAAPRGRRDSLGVEEEAGPGLYVEAHGEGSSLLGLHQELEHHAADGGHSSPQSQHNAAEKLEAHEQAGSAAAQLTVLPDAALGQPQPPQQLKPRCREREVLSGGEASPLDGQARGAHKRNRTEDGAEAIPAAATAVAAVPLLAAPTSENTPALPVPPHLGPPLLNPKPHSEAGRTGTALTTAAGTTQPSAAAATSAVIHPVPCTEVDWGEDDAHSSCTVSSSSTGSSGDGRGASRDSVGALIGSKGRASDSSAHGSRVKRKRTSHSSASPQYSGGVDTPAPQEERPEVPAATTPPPIVDPVGLALERCKERIEAIVEDTLQRKDLHDDL